VTLEDEGNAKKYEPLMYKKFVAVKTSLDARALITTIRNRQRALHFLEALTYRKYVSLQHSLKVCHVSSRTSTLSRLSCSDDCPTDTK
jgi:hypothetical protein